MEMDIKFEWAEYSSPFGPRYRCWISTVWVGEVMVYSDDIAGFFGGDYRRMTPLFKNGFATVGEAKEWVQSQAREWLASVTQEAADGVR